MFPKLLAVAVSGILTVFSFPVAFYSEPLNSPAVSALLVWVCLVPIVASVRRASPAEAFRWGYLYGFLANSFALFWISIALRKYGNLPMVTSTLILALMMSVLALYPAMALWLAAKLEPHAPRWLVGALAYTLFHWTLMYIPLEGFPWVTLAYGSAGCLPIAQAGDLVGITGIQSLIVATNFLLAESWVLAKERQPLPRRALASLGVLLALTLTYGFFRLSHFSEPAEPSKSVRIALIQGNISQEKKLDNATVQATLNTYQRMTYEVTSSNQIDLVVWPEAAVPVSIPSGTLTLPFSVGRTQGANVVLGVPTWETEPTGRTRYRNSAFVVNSVGHVQLRYDKQHLVPFGEYIPLSDVLPMHKIVPPVAGNFRKGTTPVLARLGDIPYGVLICYEVLFPDLALDLARRGARFFVNITNDAWFDPTSGPYQHASFGIFRAIETRRPIVRAANTGVTLWYDAAGRRHDATSLFTQQVVIATIHPSDSATFYMRYPHFVPLTLAIMLVLAAFGLFRRRSP